MNGDNVKDLIISCLDDDFTEFGREAFIESLGNYKGYSFVCEDKGEIVGFVNGEGNRMNHFFVKEEFRGKGIATKLFNEMKKALFSDELVREIRLNSSTYALPIYKHWGFKETGTKQVNLGCWFTPLQYNRDSHTSRK